MLKNSVLLLLFAFLHVFMSAQKEGFTRFTTKDGLLSDEVYNLHQDKQGYLWLFTNYGAMKYNSVEFRHVLRNLPFSESFIYCIYENEKGEKWVANSNAKIYQVINDSAFLVKGAEAVSEDLRKNLGEITQLHVDDSLNIYALSKRYCFKFINHKGKYTAVNLTKTIVTDSTYQILHKGNSLLPISSYPDGEAFLANDRRFNVEFEPEGPHEKKHQFFVSGVRGGPKLFRKYGDAIYFSFHDKLWKISKDRSKHFVNIGAYIQNYRKDKFGHTWVACLNKGIVELDENDSIIHHYFENTTINDVLIDSQNGLWASSTGLGLFNFKNLNTFYFKENDPLAYEISYIRKINDRLFVANTKGDVFCIEDGSIRPLYTEKPGDNYKTGKPLCVIKSGSELIFSFTYLLKETDFDKPGKSTMQPFSTIANAFKMVFLNKDSLIYIHRRGIGFLVNRKLKNRIDLDYKTNDVVYRKGLFLFATDDGIRSYGRPYPPDPTPVGNSVPITRDSLRMPEYLRSTRGILFKKIVECKHKTFWFCSIGHGIFILDSLDQLHHLSTATGLPSNIINNINFTDSEAILLSTNKGLYLSEQHPKILSPFKWTRIYVGDVSNAIAFESKIYLATTSGLIIMDLDRIDQSEHINFNFNALFVNSVEQNFKALNRIPHSHNNLEFRFDIINFSQDKIKIRYKLTGPVSDSGLVSGMAINLQNLPPGHYWLQASPDYYTSQKLKQTIHFYIAPAFWQTFSFMVFSVLILLVILALAGWLIFRNLKAKRDRKEEAERLILEYKLIALKAQINPHFMSNCLTAIQNLIISNRVELATDYIGKFGMLVRQILNFSTRSLITLEEELEITALYIELEQLRFENRFIYEFTIHENINTKALFIPTLVLNPIIENAIWHGLLPLKNKRQARLKIEIKMENDSLLLIIEDNGVGRTKAKESMSNTRESKGIALTEQRLSNINYMFNISNSQLVYTDLYHENGAAGTRVTIVLPVNLKPLSNE